MRRNANPSRIHIALSAHHPRWIREEAAMAAIAFNSAHRAEHIGGRLKPALTVLREMFDAYVSHRLRLAASEAEQIRPRQLPGTSSPSKKAQ
jgi:hypothetical protein